jgi:hypothetical protein
MRNSGLMHVLAGGKAGLHERTNRTFSTVWEAPTNNLVRTGATDVNSVRAVVKNGTIMVIVNGQTVKCVRAKIPRGDFKFRFHGQYKQPSAMPVVFPVRSRKVTAVE